MNIKVAAASAGQTETGIPTIEKNNVDDKMSGNYITDCYHLMPEFKLSNCKTSNLVQHPILVRGLGAANDDEDIVLPMYLTKKERNYYIPSRRRI